MSGSMSSGGAVHIPTKKRTGGGGGPFATKVPCNPETSVGLQAVLMEPASVNLHVAEPVRRSARRITLAVTMSRSPFCVDSCSLLCNLCDRRMGDDCVIYMYMSMGFCTEECRNEYFLEYRYRLVMAMAMEAESRRTRSEASKVTEEEEATGDRRIFFTCAEVESFP